MLLEVLLGSLSIFLFLFWRCLRRGNAPPGPTPFPVVGNLLQLAMTNSKRPYDALDKLAKKYGDIMSIRIGLNDMIILSSYEALRDTMNKDAWNGRIWSDDFYDRYMHQRIGIMFTEGEFWKDQRRFVLRHLREVGFGKQTSMEVKIHEELKELMENIENNMGDGQQTIIYMENFFNLSFLNILWALIAGTRYNHSDSQLKKLLESLNMLFKSGSLGSGGLTAVFPVLKKIAPKMTGNERQIQVYKDIQEFIKTAIQQHRESHLFGSSHDFIDIYLQEVNRTKDVPNSYYTEDQLTMLCLDLFFAGSETTSNTLSYAILYMILNPEVQQRVYEEIENIIGLERTPALDDKSRLPYTEAVLMEVQRISNVTPFAPPHQILADVKFREFTIAKNTPVLINLYSINMNKSYWGDPGVFRPERFMTSSSQLSKPEYFVPFGLGKRVCLGESLAKMSLFLYFTTLIQNFKFETVPGHLSPNTDPVVGFTLSPEPYNTFIAKRHAFLIK